MTTTRNVAEYLNDLSKDIDKGLRVMTPKMSGLNELSLEDAKKIPEVAQAMRSHEEVLLVLKTIESDMLGKPDFEAYRQCVEKINNPQTSLNPLANFMYQLGGAIVSAEKFAGVVDKNMTVKVDAADYLNELSVNITQGLRAINSSTAASRDKTISLEEAKQIPAVAQAMHSCDEILRVLKEIDKKKYDECVSKMNKAQDSENPLVNFMLKISQVKMAADAIVVDQNMTVNPASPSDAPASTTNVAGVMKKLVGQGQDAAASARAALQAQQNGDKGDKKDEKPAETVSASQVATSAASATPEPTAVSTPVARMGRGGKE